MRPTSMPGNPDPASLRIESEQLLVQFLDRELELTQTLLELTRLEFQSGPSGHSLMAVKHVAQGLETIGKFLDRISDSGDRERIAGRFRKLELDARPFVQKAKM